MNRIMIVDDEKSIRVMLKRVLSDKQFEIDEAADGREALEKIKQGKYSAILLDLRMPEVNGIEVIEKLKEQDIDTPIVMMSAYGTVPEAVEAMKLGALDYLVKPFDLDELKLILERIIRQNEIQKENIYFREEEDKKFNFKEIVGESSAMKRVLEMVKKVAHLPTTVLITGESGTGKELIARAIYKNSPRQEKPFVVANCVAFSSNLLESELFGHEKGAFTGANSTRIGRFEIAHNGTLFLDEIGEITLSTQAKLLRVIQEKEFERVGSSTSIKVDTRIVAATNKDLLKEIKENRFREDLFYRINVFTIDIPPLRARIEDIPLLVQHFIRKYNQILNKRITGISQEAISLLMDYTFPGNIRELENIIERAMIMCNNTIMDRNLFFFLEQKEGFTEAGTLKEMEREMIKKTLILNNGNRTKTAQSLGISRRSLLLKLKGYHIDIKPGKGK
ncbi:MAG: sigma-54-dependent Fis family transcriptional regulator [Candidatus Atribacteria bacterium]|nr:sigma-54-dependent Fis family transcriptional regulator [Candidatus Atribacteria bacterium]